MNQAPTIGQGAEAAEQALRDELARCDAATEGAVTALRHLVANESAVLFNDAVVARVRGTMLDLARQLLAQPEGPQEDDRDAREDRLADALAADAALLTHAHARVLEGHLAERLQARCGVDEVLSPLVRQLAASGDAERSALANALAVSQARFVHDYRQMELPLAELPARLLDRAIQTLRSMGGAQAAAAEHRLRAAHDESASRLALLARFVAAVPDARDALSVEHAGVAVFASALARASRQARDVAVLSFAEAQAPRFALALRAAGLGPRAVEQQLQALHPEGLVPEGFETLSVSAAAALLSAARPAAG